MHITILTIGSRGDVQPYVALGTGLHQVGHDVRIATYDKFQTMIEDRGLEFSPVSSDVSDMTRNLHGKGFGELVCSWRRLAQLMPFLAERLWTDMWSACQGTEAIVYSFIASLIGHCAAEQLKVPSIASALYPIVSPTRAFPSPVFWALPLGGSYNWLTHIAFVHCLWQAVCLIYSHMRYRNPNLPTLPGRPYEQSNGKPIPILYGYSSIVVPKPPDWNERREVTGYWFLNTPIDWQPPEDLVYFLESGPPPVYIGFGSMNLHSPEEVTNTVLQALARTGHRGLLLEGRGGLGNTDLPDEVFKIKSVPHDWLFPRMAAVVHHGGAGTTAAGFRAGIPSVIVPFIADQQWWGRRIAALGVGPKPIQRKKLTVDRLAAAITIATSEHDMQRRAVELGQKIRAENGVARATEVLHRHLSARCSTAWGEQRPTDRQHQKRTNTHTRNGLFSP